MTRSRRHCALLLAALVASACGRETPDPSATPSEPQARAKDAPAAHAVEGWAPVTGTGTPAIVVLEARHASPLPPPVSVPFMDQEARTFIPSILFARAGHPIEFRNSDPEIHNVNVKDALTRVQAFNVAVPTGEKYLYTFPGSGVYDVTCDVHAGMEAHVVVASSPYATYADAQGRFRFPDVVPGTYMATVYAGPRTLERLVDVSGPLTDIDWR